MFRNHQLVRHPRVPANPSKYFKPTVPTSRTYPQSTTASSPSHPHNTPKRFGTPTGPSPVASVTVNGHSFFPEARQSASLSPQPQHNNDLDVNEGVSRVVHHAVCDLCDSDIRGHRYVSLKRFYPEMRLHCESPEMPCLPRF